MPSRLHVASHLALPFCVHEDDWGRVSNGPMFYPDLHLRQWFKSRNVKKVIIKNKNNKPAAKPMNYSFTMIFVFLEGKDRHLCSVDLKQVMSRARQTNSTVPLNALTPQAIEKITNCHLFAVGEVCSSDSRV